MPLIIVPGAGSFNPSSMTKSGAAQKLTSTFADIVTWIADTTGYPGSTLSGNGLRNQGGNAAATVTATLPFSGGGGGGGTQQAQLAVNGIPVVPAGAVITGTSGTLSVTATLKLADGDVVTVQAQCTAQLTGWESSIQTGAGTFVRIT